MIEMEIPKDVMAVETTLVGPLSARQAVCFGITGIVEYGYYMMISRMGLGLDMDNLIGMGVLLALPILAFCFVKPYGLPLERYIVNVFCLAYLAPRIRTYQIQNLYLEDEKPDVQSKQKKYSSGELKRHPEYVMYK